MKPSKQPIKLFLADVDGTLVTHDKVLTDRAQKAVRDLKAKGILFAITSGRPPKGMKMVIDPLAIETPVAGFNGGLFTNPDLSEIEQHTLPPEIAKKAAGIILKSGLDCWVYRDDDWYVRDLKAPHVDREKSTVKFDPKVTDDIEALLDHAIKIVGISDDLDLVAKVEKQVQEAVGTDATAARSQPYYLDVTHKDANKGTVVAFLAKRYGIDPGAIATIGDMPNDVTMFQVSGLSIAMGNASDEVKAKADCTTDSYEDEGFAKAVEKYLLN
jgi:Cof subfamily protein (haloacid dehalogenase superfamily)